VAETLKRPKRSILIAARLISLAIGLAGAEGILWLGGYPGWWQTLGISRNDFEYAPDPELGWKNREGRFDMVDPQRNIPFHYTNWSQGRRATADGEPAPNPENPSTENPSSNKPRVLFFGDSYVQGYGLSNQQTFAWMAQKAHPGLAISNFGTADYGTYQSYLAIRVALAKHVRGPCSVFYLFNSFHELRNVAEPDWIRIVKQPPPGLFFPYAEMAGGTLQGRQSRGEMVWPVSRWLRTAALAQDYYRRIESYSRTRTKRAVTEALLLKMNETVLAAGGKFTVIFFDVWPKDRPGYREFARSHGIPFVDCDHPEMTDRRFRLPDGHPNEELNRLLAQWIEPLPLAGGESNERAGKL
jgi:hypothetical protein